MKDRLRACRRARPPTGWHRALVGRASGPCASAGARLAFSDIADARGGADGFAAQFDESARRSPMVAAAIAERRLGAPAALEDADTERWGARRPNGTAPLGRDAGAQAARWARFEAALSEGACETT